MYHGMLRLQLPKGVLTYIEFVEELLHPAQSHQRRGTKNYFSKQKQILHQQTIEMKQLKEKPTFKNNYISSQKADFHPLLRVSRCHSTLRLWQLIQSLVHPVSNFFVRKQS